MFRRYLDPKTSRWLSTDPALGEYIPQAPVNDEAKKANQNLPGMGGIYNQVNFHVYHYAGNNPVKYVDPDGRWFYLAKPVADLVVFVGLLVTFVTVRKAGETLADAIQESNHNNNSANSQAENAKENLQDSAKSAVPSSPKNNDDNDDNNENDSKSRQPASEKRAKSMAKQIEKDLGADARKEFHDAKNGGPDRTLQELKQDAADIYQDYGKEAPQWMIPD